MATLSCQYTPIPTTYSHHPPPPTSYRVTFEEHPIHEGFAFASMKGDVFLVQTSRAPSSAVSLKIYRHEFSSIFRLAHCAIAEPSEIKILESIDDQLTRYEEESETVFLAKELTERLRQMTERRSSIVSRGYYSPRRRR